jgi:hypothetical protein
VASFLRSMATMKVVRFSKVTSAEQKADGLSKLVSAPLQNARTIARIQGKHPENEAYVALVIKLGDKRGAGKRKRLAAEAATAEAADGSAAELVEAAYESEAHGVAYAARILPYSEAAAPVANAIQSKFTFLQCTKDFTARMMAGMGFTGSGGLGRHEQGVAEAARLSIRPKHSGLGFTGGMAGSGGKGFIPAAAAHSTQGVEGVTASGGGSGTVSLPAYNAAEVSSLEVSPPEEQGVFLAERIRRALAKLTPAERMFFNTRLRGGPFEDILISDEQAEAMGRCEVPVPMPSTHFAGSSRAALQEGAMRQQLLQHRGSMKARADPAQGTNSSAAGGAGTTASINRNRSNSDGAAGRISSNAGPGDKAADSTVEAAGAVQTAAASVETSTWRQSKKKGHKNKGSGRKQRNSTKSCFFKNNTAE